MKYEGVLIAQSILCHPLLCIYQKMLSFIRTVNLAQIFYERSNIVLTALLTIFNLQDLVKESESEKLLNFTAPSLLGMIDGLTKYLQQTPDTGPCYVYFTVCFFLLLFK